MAKKLQLGWKIYEFNSYFDREIGHVEVCDHYDGKIKFQKETKPFEWLNPEDESKCGCINYYNGGRPTKRGQCFQHGKYKQRECEDINDPALEARYTKWLKNIAKITIN